MPTVRQNIAYAYNGFMSRHRLAAVHLIKSALAIVLIVQSNLPSGSNGSWQSMEPFDWTGCWDDLK